jgi:hypothetical protein
MTQSIGVAPIAPNPIAEPGLEWKDALRRLIKESLMHRYNDAKEALDQKFRGGSVGCTRARLAKEHGDTSKKICQIADDLYRDQIEQEQQQLQWA